MCAGAVETMTRMIRRPNTRAAAVTMLGKTLELCSDKVRSQSVTGSVRCREACYVFDPACALHRREKRHSAVAQAQAQAQNVWEGTTTPCSKPSLQKEWTIKISCLCTNTKDSQHLNPTRVDSFHACVMGAHGHVRSVLDRAAAQVTSITSDCPVVGSKRVPSRQDRHTGHRCVAGDVCDECRGRVTAGG